MCNDEIKEILWNSLDPIEGLDSNVYRRDPCGAAIKLDNYKDRSDEYGWEIDHIVPRALLKEHFVPDEEIEDQQNLRAMHWKNNDAKGLDYPVYHSKVIYEDGENKQIDGIYEVNKERQRILKVKFQKYGI